MRPLIPLLALALGACVQAGPRPVAAPAGGAALPPATASGPAGAGCAGEVARTRGVIDNDLAAGQVNRRVHDRIAADLRAAETVCAAGREAEALRLVAATRARHGYR